MACAVRSQRVVDRIIGALNTASTLLFGAAVGVMSMTPPEFTLAKVCFLGAAAAFAGIVVIWAFQTHEPLLVRLPAAAIGGIIILVGTPTIFHMINNKEKASYPPDLTIRIVHIDVPAIEIINASDKTADNVRTMSLVWNLDNKNKDPIPMNNLHQDFLRLNQKTIPIRLFDSVASQLSTGDRLSGSINVSCPGCAISKTYWLYVEWGKGGWYAELPEESSHGGLIVPESLKDKTPEEFARQFMETIPDNKRITISDK